MATEAELPYVLILDDQEANLRLLEAVFESESFECELVALTDPHEALALISQRHPDIILLDIHMPEIDGYEVMQRVRQLVAPGDHLPIIVLTADNSPQARMKALSAGATDFLPKPFDPTETMLRVTNLLQTRKLTKMLNLERAKLEERVLMRTQQLEETRIEILQRLSLAAEFRDDVTGDHTRRVGVNSARIAKEIGLDPDRVKLIERVAPLHDVGKIGVPDRILLKPGPLTPEEFAVMKTHVEVGARILSGSKHEILRVAETIAMTHHEKWDGSGYPRSLSGEAIPIEGRIVALVDVFDALTHERPYKAAWALDRSIDEIVSSKGGHFDPAIVEAFLSCVDELQVTTSTFRAVRDRLSSGSP